MSKQQNILKEQQKMLKEKKKYKNTLLKKTHTIIKKILTKYKKLKKDEKNILSKYKGAYYQNINNYLIDNNISYYNLEDFFREKQNIKKIKHTKFSLVNNNFKNTKKKSFFNLMEYFNKYKDKINKEITLLDSIITNYGETEQTYVYRGIHDNNKKNSLMKQIMKTSNKKGNKIIIETFQSTSLDINVSENFVGRKNKGMLLQIDTNNFPYFYLPWNIDSGTLKKEKIQYSEFELLLPRNIEMEYLGKEKIKTNRNIVKNWNNYTQKGYNLLEIYLYKFKIVKKENPKPKPKEQQKNIEIPIGLMNNLYFIN
jgi:hypothetical protein